MKKILLLHFSLFFLIANCQKKKQVMNIISTNNSENIEIKKDTMPDLDIASIKKLLDEEYNLIDANNAPPSPENTIKWINSEIYKSLLKNGYKSPSQQDFEAKIQTIFGVDTNGKLLCNRLKKEKGYILLYGEDPKKNYIYKEIPRAEFYPYQATGNIFLMMDNHFMSFIISPVRIVNFSKDSTHYKVKLPQYVISRNKYLFNDDKSQFAWLINNDEDFMQSLVTTFGYTEDKKLLKWAFEKQGFSNYQKYPPDNIMENYGKFLWTKQCNGEINLHPNTLYLIKELSEPSINKDKYLLNLAEYINYLVNNEKETELNLQQKAKIAAYLLAFGEQYKYNKEYGYNQMFLGKFIFYQDPDKKYKKEFEKNNYYNLPNLKKWYQQAEQEKDMFENDQTLADDPQPKDYVYRATYYKGPYSK
ncbi:hypothetical protein [Apibacter adventoris]|uniref:hypothetical protein n=1 Tax=Apibacter adventoris TaxID=1679466 RepID=UPI000CF6D2D8|nr:hypothetical protein [Apibacter adventoris]PQL95930.1 hypothetical protein C4S76_00060 [Apibacter adventoris]